MSESTLHIGVLFPEVLGTYGDTGNALVLQKRAQWRGIDAQIIEVGLDDAVPDSLDIYLLGGGEDIAQAHAAAALRQHPNVIASIEHGTPLLAICAGLQILGEWYVDGNNKEVAGLGILDCTTRPQGTRTIGELVSRPTIDGLTDLLTGFENHGGATKLGQDAQPLGRVVSGSGNARQLDDPDQDSPLCDGVVQGSIIATYMHGPALARNPQLADLVLSRAISTPLTPLEQHQLIDALRSERITYAGIQ